MHMRAQAADNFNSVPLFSIDIPFLLVPFISKNMHSTVEEHFYNFSVKHFTIKSDRFTSGRSSVYGTRI